MKDEQALNTVIKNSLQWAEKIPDASGNFAVTPRAFDGFGISHNGLPVYWEAKYLKTMESFNLQKIEDHQITNLLTIKRLCPIAQCWIVLGVSVSRGDNRVYIFGDVEDINNRRIDRRNYLKKELETLPYHKVVKGVICWDSLSGKVVNTPDRQTL